MGDRGAEGTARRRRKPAAAEADRFPRELRASTRRLRQAPRAAAAPPPAALSSGPRLSGAEPAAPHLGLKSWKRPLRFMAENFTAAASSSPRPLHRAACALQRVHGARASRVPAAAAAARNLSHRLSPPPFRASVRRPRMRLAGLGRRRGSRGLCGSRVTPPILLQPFVPALPSEEMDTGWRL